MTKKERLERKQFREFEKVSLTWLEWQWECGNILKEITLPSRLQKIISFCPNIKGVDRKLVNVVDIFETDFGIVKINWKSR